MRKILVSFSFNISTPTCEVLSVVTYWILPATVHIYKTGNIRLYTPFTMSTPTFGAVGVVTKWIPPDTVHIYQTGRPLWPAVDPVYTYLWSGRCCRDYSASAPGWCSPGSAASAPAPRGRPPGRKWTASYRSASASSPRWSCRCRWLSKAHHPVGRMDIFNT